MEPSTSGTRTRRRATQRQPLCCTECARRKLRCSKVIPCSACVDRGNEHLCRREKVQIRRVPPRSTTRSEGQRGSPPPPPAEERLRPPILHPSQSPSSPSTPGSITPRATTGAPHHHDEPCPAEQNWDEPRTRSAQQALIDGVAQDAVVTLEFLAQGRQRVMQLGQHPRAVDSSASSPQSPGSPNQILPASQARALIKYHEESLAWMHNVLHCPTFRDESELFFETGHVVSPFWLPLYYTILSTTLFLASPSVLSEYNIFDAEKFGEELYRKSIEALFASNFMASHSLLSVQTICLLIHVGHNLGESDFIATLMGSAIRIAQSLGLHRLGPDGPIAGVSDPNEISRRLTEREVQKRVWWFLIRQDWLQIPFLNTYTIHATQFNTPMPSLCHENTEGMIRDEKIVEQDTDTYTQGSYTTVHNHISVLIWKTQDRLCSLGHPSKMPDGLRKLYEEVIIADSELKKIMKRMPVFYREDSAVSDGSPPHITQQRRVMLLSMCHKFLTIHRHFQVPSFKDPWFSFTKISCLSIARRCLQELFSLPNDQYTWIARSLWTTSTHMVAAAVSLMFEELFTEAGESMIIDPEEIESLVRQCSHSLREMCGRSEIARKGVRIIDSLLDLTEDLRNNKAGQFDLEKIIRHVREDAPAQTHLQMDLTEIDLLDCLNWPSPEASGRQGIADLAQE